MRIKVHLNAHGRHRKKPELQKDGTSTMSHLQCLIQPLHLLGFFLSS